MLWGDDYLLIELNKERFQLNQNTIYIECLIAFNCSYFSLHKIGCISAIQASLIALDLHFLWSIKGFLKGYL